MAMNNEAKAIWNEVLAGLSEGKVAELMDLHSYQGFNPNTFLNMMVDRFIHKGNISRETFIADMKEVLIFYAVRGTKIEKGQTKSKEASRERLRVLRDRYDIKDNVQAVSAVRGAAARVTSTGSAMGGVALPPETITVARIAGCFANLVCKLMEMDGARHVVSIPGMYKGLAWSGAPAVIPKTNVTLFNMWLKWAIEFDKVIKGDAADAKMVEKYGRIVWNSPLLPTDSKRQGVLETLSKTFE